MKSVTHEIENHEFFVYTEKDHYTYPYDWASMQSPVFFCILRAFHESSEWILKGRKIRIIMHEPFATCSTANPELWVMNRNSPLGVAQLARYPDDARLLSHADLQTLSSDINWIDHQRLMHTVAIAGTIFSMENELAYDRSLESTQSFSYRFKTNEIPMADAFLQKMSGACAKLGGVDFDLTQSDLDENPDLYCTMTWIGPLRQIEEIVRQSVDLGIELGFIKSPEDLQRHFSVNTSIPKL